MMEARAHGGDWAGFQARHGGLPLDFSANISPLGVPEGVQAAIRAAAGEADRYPDPLCRTLRQAIACREGTAPERVLCGSGAADLIYRAVWALRPRRAMVTAPTFSEYQAALESAGCAVAYHMLLPERDFRLGAEILAALTPETELLFLCEPNNPTGITTDLPLLEAVLDRCRETGTHVVMDACFMDFLDTPRSLTPWLDRYPHLLILRAFTKLYALAGVRLGYALCADAALLEGMRRAGQSWPVSHLAQAAGLAALEETAYRRRVRALTARERPWLAGALAKLGLRVVPGEANYLLFQSPVPLLTALEERGILLRGCENYPGLDASWHRAAVRTHGENTRFVQALAAVLDGASGR